MTMQIDPLLQLRLLLAAFFAGLMLGGLSECGRVLRMLLGGHTPPDYMKAVYARPLPLLKVPVRFVGRAPQRGRRRVVAFLFDLCFCLIFGVVGVLVQYRYYDGAFRAMVPIGMLGGFFLWRLLIARPAARAVAWLAYLFGALLCYVRALVLLPWRLFYRFWRLLVTRLLLPTLCCLKRARERRVSRLLCQRQLQMARAGLVGHKARIHKIKEDKHVKKKKGRHARFALDHSHTDRCAVLRGGGDRR